MHSTIHILLYNREIDDAQKTKFLYLRIPYQCFDWIIFKTSGYCNRNMIFNKNKNNMVPTINNTTINVYAFLLFFFFFFGQQTHNFGCIKCSVISNGALVSVSNVFVVCGNFVFYCFVQIFFCGYCWVRRKRKPNAIILQIILGQWEPFI